MLHKDRDKMNYNHTLKIEAKISRRIGTIMVTVASAMVESDNENREQSDSIMRWILELEMEPRGVKKID